MGPPPNWGWYKIPHESGREMFPVLGRELPLVPRSVCDEELIDFAVRMQDGDELWDWSSPPRTWEYMMGRGGVALVRDGRVIAEVITRMN